MRNNLKNNYVRKSFPLMLKYPGFDCVGVQFPKRDLGVIYMVNFLHA